MKKLFFALLCAVCGVATLKAQDVVTLNNTDEIECRIEEVNENDIRYRKWSNPDGPVYTLLKSDIFMIKYQNGEKEIFGGNRMSPRTELQADYEYPYPPVTKSYSAGDYFNEGGVEGIVFYATDNGRHGLIMATNPLEYHMSFWRVENQWSVSNMFVNATDRNDGWVNMLTVENFVKDTGESWDEFPMFRECHNRGEGWYIPSLNEAILIVLAYNGGSLEPYDKAARKRFEAVFKQHGGVMKRYTKLRTSTECGDFNNFAVDVDDAEKGMYSKKIQDNTHVDYPIHKF